ncbi:hypothetical protein FJY63_01685 [Candidatus Sumerlaeota bacterium]|nr:hypothetical protein [Candidatus Sumerlaeota bacterium]
MKITLETVREVLRNALGFESFVASFITEVHEDPGHPSAGITRDGRLCYNPGFVARFVATKEDLFCLIFHELLHPMFGHFIHGAGQIENIAADAVINAVISTVYCAESNNGALFTKTHERRGLDGIMRPESEMGNSRYSRVYDKLYHRQYGNSDSLSTGELIQTLKILTETEKIEVVLLLGTHGEACGMIDNGLTGLDPETLGRIAEELKRSATEAMSHGAGHSETLVAMLMEALRTHLSIRKALLQRFAIKRKVDRFKELFHERRIAVSPIPLHPSKRDLVMIAAGTWPIHFHNQVGRPKQHDRGIAIYLDVSGSVNEHLPEILGILKGLRREIKSIFQFSNKVVETQFETLLKGKIETTFGTDFNCIAQSILQRGFEKAVIITDGCASMNDDLKEQLKKRGLKTLTILFDGETECDDFAEFGDVVQLEDVSDNVGH